MLYPAKVITAVPPAESLAAGKSATVGKSVGHDTFGCSITLPTEQEWISIGSTVLISWSVQSNVFGDTTHFPTSSTGIDVDLMRGQHEQNIIVDSIKQNLDTASRSTLWYINSSLPIADNYYLRISSNSTMQCYGPKFALQEFHGDNLANRTSNSLVGTPKIEPETKPAVEDRTVRNVVASSSQTVNSNLANLVAGLLVFGAFLWV